MVTRLCLYVLGAPGEDVEQAHGTYMDWFAGLATHLPIELVEVDGRDGQLPQLDQFDGFVVSGSPASLAAPEPWMESSIELVRYAAQANKPLLGVCFGHQLIGAAFGGSVVENPAGWELSTETITLSAEATDDPLFDGLPEALQVNLSHRDIVDYGSLAPANGIRVLASNAKCDVQVLAAHERIRGVQFHPEFTGAITKAYIRDRRDELATDAQRRGEPADHPDRRLERTVDCPDGAAVFANFVKHYCVG